MMKTYETRLHITVVVIPLLWLGAQVHATAAPRAGARGQAVRSHLTEMSLTAALQEYYGLHQRSVVAYITPDSRTAKKLPADEGLDIATLCDRFQYESKEFGSIIALRPRDVRDQPITDARRAAPEPFYLAGIQSRVVRMQLPDGFQDWGYTVKATDVALGPLCQALSTGTNEVSGTVRHHFLPPRDSIYCARSMRQDHITLIASKVPRIDLVQALVWTLRADRHEYFVLLVPSAERLLPLLRRRAGELARIIWDGKSTEDRDLDALKRELVRVVAEQMPSALLAEVRQPNYEMVYQAVVRQKSSTPPKPSWEPFQIPFSQLPVDGQALCLLAVEMRSSRGGGQLAVPISDARQVAETLHRMTVSVGVTPLELRNEQPMYSVSFCIRSKENSPEVF